MDSFIAIPPAIKQSNTPTPDSRRAEISPVPSGGVGTPGSLAGGLSVPASAGSAVGAGQSNTGIKTEDESEEELRRSEAAVETLQQMDLWSLVLDLMTRIQEGTVTAKTVDNEAGIIRARIARAHMSLKQVSGLDVSMGERKEEISRLEEAIQKKQDLLVRFQAVMGGNSSESKRSSATVVSIKKEAGTGEENTSSSLQVKEESVDPITDMTDLTGNGSIEGSSTSEGDSKIAAASAAATTAVAAATETSVPAASDMSGISGALPPGLDVSGPSDLDVFMSGMDGVPGIGDSLPAAPNDTDELKSSNGGAGMMYNLPLDPFNDFDF